MWTWAVPGLLWAIMVIRIPCLLTVFPNVLPNDRPKNASIKLWYAYKTCSQRQKSQLSSYLRTFISYGTFTVLNVQNTVSLNDVSEDVKHNIFSSHSLPSNSSPATAATKRHGLVTNQWSCHTFFTISKGSKGKTIKEEKIWFESCSTQTFQIFPRFSLSCFFVLN